MNLKKYLINNKHKFTKPFLFSASILALLSGVGTLAYADSKLPILHSIKQNDISLKASHDKHYANNKNVLVKGYDGAHAYKDHLTLGDRMGTDYEGDVQGTQDFGSPNHFNREIPDYGSSHSLRSYGPWSGHFTNAYGNWDRYNIGHFHSGETKGDLQDGSGSKDVYFVKLNSEGSHITGIYNNAIQVLTKNKKGKYVRKNANMALYIHNIKFYKPWRGNHSIVLSKNLADGIEYNGVKQMDLDYQVLDPTTNQPMKGLGTSYFRFTGVDGLSKYRWTRAETQDVSTNNENRTQYIDNRYAGRHYHTLGHNDYTGEYVSPVYTTGKEAGKAYSQSKHSTIRHYYSNILGSHIDGGAYGTYGTGKARSIVIGFKNQVVIRAGSGTGYGSFAPSTTIKAPVVKPKPKPNYYYCGISNNKEHIYHFYKGKAHEIKRGTLLKTSHIKPSMLHINGSQKNSAKQNRELGKYIKKGKLTGKSGLNGWLDDAHCIIKPNIPNKQKKHKKQTTNTYPKPIKPVVKPLKKSLSNIHHADIDGYDGGQLSHPDQDFDYKLTGKVPNMKHMAYTYQPDYANETHWWKRYNGVWVYKTKVPHYKAYYLPDSDSYKVIDQIPKEVSVIGNPSLHFENTDKTIYTQNVNDGNNNKVEFDLSPQEMKDYSNGKYTITIPVKANHLPSVNKGNFNNNHHWTEFWNGGKDGSWKGNNNYQNNAYEETNINWGDNGTRDTYKKDYSNHIPVEIKKVVAHIINYNWDNPKGNPDHKLFPENDKEADSLGLVDQCGKGQLDKIADDKGFKNYRFKGTYVKSSKLSSHDDYGYVNTVFGVGAITKYDDKQQQHQYRFIYPMAHWTDSRIDNRDALNPKDLTDNDGTLHYSFKHNEQDLVKNSEAWRGHRGDPSYRVPVNFNPDGCGNDAYSNSGFSQTNYFPYLIPHIDMNNNTPRDSQGNIINHPTQGEITKANDKSNRLVIDTDTQKHGLPFHFNTTAFNQMYNKNEHNGFGFENDFNGLTGKDSNMTKVRLTIKDPDTGDTLYRAVRPLADLEQDTGDNSADVFYHGNSFKNRFNDAEYPKGDYQWHGFMDSKALNKVREAKRYDLNTKNDDKSSKEMSEGFPVKVHFSLANNPHKIELTQHNVHSHAYTSTKPNVTKDSFGKTYVQKYDDDPEVNNDNGTDGTEAKYLLPERTTKYGTKGDDSTNVRDSREEMDMVQPKVSTAKSGYGLTGNDVGVKYMGHINTAQYAKLGSSLLTAFPQHFNNRDTDMRINEDPYRHTFTDKHGLNYNNGTVRKELMEAEPMLHVDAKLRELKNHGNAENNGTYKGTEKHLPDNLDTYAENGSKEDYDDASSADQYFNNLSEHHVDGKLSTGLATTTYGYLPKEVTTNAGGANENEPLNEGGTNAGMIRLSSDTPSNKYDTQNGWFEPKLSTEDSLNTASVDGNPNIEEQNAPISGTNSRPDMTDHQTAPVVNMTQDGENERLFTPDFLQDGTYDLDYESMFGFNGHEQGVDSKAKRTHRLGANFFTIDDDNPVHIYGHMLRVTGTDTQNEADEFNLQPILSNPNGLFQIPNTYPLFPKAHKISNYKHLTDQQKTDLAKKGILGEFTSIYDTKNANDPNVWLSQGNWFLNS